ncbi:hypothetical protein ACFSJS_10615 [Streptomyces desertarenae]|uniref:NlpC/P60 family protein n=1 Tax=Streptomyces desertarenae TaxID=2666184 RepID=A0ABW4PIN4_9ACTN
MSGTLGRAARAVVAAAVAAAVAASAVPVAASAAPAPAPAAEPPGGYGDDGYGPDEDPGGAYGPDGSAPESVSALLTRMRELYGRAERAAGAHRATERRLTAQREKVGRVQRDLADVRVRLDRARDEAGRLARRQYRETHGTVPAHLRLLLSRDEREVRAVFDHQRLLERAAAHRVAAARRLSVRERRLDRLAGEARGALDRQLALTERHGRQRDEAAGHLAEVERALASLGDDELAALRRAEEALRPRRPRRGRRPAG